MKVQSTYVDIYIIYVYTFFLAGGPWRCYAMLCEEVSTYARAYLACELLIFDRRIEVQRQQKSNRPREFR